LSSCCWLCSRCPESGTRTNRAGHFVFAIAERGRSGPSAPTWDPGSGDPRHLRQWHRLSDYAPSDPGLVQKLYAKGVSITASPSRTSAWLVSLLVSWLLHRADRRVDIPVAANAAARQSHGLWQVARQNCWPKRMAASRLKMSPASTRPSRICRRSSNSLAIRENSSPGDAFRGRAAGRASGTRQER